MYTINVKYYGIEVADARDVMPISPIFKPTNSYVDSEIYTKGHAAVIDPAVAAYGKSVFASNVTGWGKLGFKVDPEVCVPFPSGIKNVNITKVGEMKTGEGNKKYYEIEFEVADYKDYLYYLELAQTLKEDGYVITVSKAAEAPGP